MTWRQRAIRWAFVLLPALAIYFAPFGGLNAGQRHLLAIFVATIIAQVAQPVAMGVSVVTAMAVLVLTGTLPGTKVLSGFANPTIWMVFTAFLFARAITLTRLGLRIAYLFIRRFGHNALTLGYSVAASDAVLAPFVPSDTARGGGIVYPIARSLAQVFGSEAGPTANKIGSFLMLTAFHTTYTASAMFLTGMVSNPLIADFAAKIAHVELNWIRWASAAIVPGLLTLTIVPYLLYRLNPPEIRDTRQAQRLAMDKLHRMGRLSSREIRLVVILAGMMLGWITSPWHSLPNAFVTLSGLAAILLCGVITWDDLLNETTAWNAMIWFAPLVMMGDALAESGVIKLISESAFGAVTHWPWPVAAAAIVIGYLYVHYGFASMTAQVTALYPTFLAAGLAAGAPPMFVALALAFFSNLDAGLTHYGTGSAPVFFGAGYVSQAAWWRFGLIISLVNVIVWLGIGPLWWRLLGLW